MNDNSLSTKWRRKRTLFMKPTNKKMPFCCFCCKTNNRNAMCSSASNHNEACKVTTLLIESKNPPLVRKGTVTFKKKRDRKEMKMERRHFIMCPSETARLFSVSTKEVCVVSESWLQVAVPLLGLIFRKLIQGDPSGQFQPPVDIVLTVLTVWGRHCSYLLPRQDGRTSQIQVNGRLWPIQWVIHKILYCQPEIVSLQTQTAFSYEVQVWEMCTNGECIWVCT